ncbi:DUF4296 domain-containing protein [Limibacter armeniacum]|uniref:DUF4296 domain-containing protein n=1 Tax=Limibacter armeniacum TaxID=466084 RepID=UPI002FE50E41
MKKLLTIAFIAVLSLTGCQQEKKEVPANLISKEKMADIIVDTYIAEATVSAKGVKKFEGIKLFEGLYNDIIQKYDLDTAVYRTSYTYYLENGEEMKEIYEIVKERLKAEKDSAEDAINTKPSDVNNTK